MAEGRTCFDCRDVVRDVVELYEPAAEEIGLAIAADVGPPLVIDANRELIGQALANLVDNALKYGRPVADPVGDTAPPAIIVRADRVGMSILLSVADPGQGIAAGDRLRVVDRFVRLEGARTRPGSGLGLSLVGAVARLHGGELRFEDNHPGLKAVLILPAPATEAMALPQPDRIAPPGAIAAP